MKQVQVKCRGADLKQLNELVAFHGDIKKLSKANLEKLKKAVLKYGFIAPVFIWKNGRSLFILDGHQRIKALVSLRDEGYVIPPLPVDYIDAANEKEAKEKLLHITSQYGEFDKKGLDAFIFEANLDISNLDTIRLTNTELKISGLQNLGETEGDDDVPRDSPALSKPGDLWELGKHRLLCGDCLEPSRFKELLNEQKTDLVVTDPPYNVDYTGKTKQALKIKNDKKKDYDFLEFLIVCLTNMVAWIKAGASFYIFHADSEGYNFRAACKSAELDIRQCLIWNKDTMVMGRQDYHWQHEPILYGWKSGGTHSWYSDRKQTTVIDFPRPSQSKEHPTMKPVGLIAYLILNSSKEEDIVLDGFLGSGSTILACEKTNRVCYGLELDAGYCDVIVKRYYEWCVKNNRKREIKHNGKIVDYKQLNQQSSLLSI